MSNINKDSNKMLILLRNIREDKKELKLKGLK
jgi:hypothetical protein